MKKPITIFSSIAISLALITGIGLSIDSGLQSTKLASANTVDAFELATSISAGDQIIFTSMYGGKHCAMSDQLDGKRAATYVNHNAGVIEATSKTAIFTVGVGDGRYTFHDGRRYLYNGTINDAAYLRSEADIDALGDRAYWNVTFNETEGHAHVNCPSQLKPTIRFNDGKTFEKSYFNCHKPASKRPIYIYKRVITETIDSFMVENTPTYPRTATPSVDDWRVRAHLKEQDAYMDVTSGLSFVETPDTSTAGVVDLDLRYTVAEGTHSLTNGNDIYDIHTTMTINPLASSVSFKEPYYYLNTQDSLSLYDEIVESGDGVTSFEIIEGSEYVSIQNGVVVPLEYGSATIKATKGAEHGSLFEASATTRVVVQNVATWTHNFGNDFRSRDESRVLTDTIWNIDTDAGFFGSAAQGNGQQVGSANNPATSIVLSTLSFEGYNSIQSIKVVTGGANGLDAILSVQVGNTTYLCGGNTSANISSAVTDYLFTALPSDSGEIIITWLQPSTSKAIYIKSIEITYDATPVVQGGIRASWATTKGTYFNGLMGTNNTLHSDHLVIETLNTNGKAYGPVNSNGTGFVAYVTNSLGQWLQSDKTFSDVETPLFDATSIKQQQSFKDLEAGTYSLYVTTLKTGGEVWTSATIDLVIVDRAPVTIELTSAPQQVEFVAYSDVFAPYTGNVNITYNDGGEGNNRRTVVHYYEGNTQIDINVLLNYDDIFEVSTDRIITARVYDYGYVGGDFIYATYDIYIYASTFSVSDGNGTNVNYGSGTSTVLNPDARLHYVDKDGLSQSKSVDSALLDLYIKEQGALGDGTLYSGVLPQVSQETMFTITVIHKNYPLLRGTYDIKVVEATFSVDATNAQTTFIYGTNFVKTGLVGEITYGGGTPITVDLTDCTVEHLDGGIVDVIDFIGPKTVLVRYQGFTATYEITGTNVGSSEEYIHDPIPGGYVAGEPQTSTDYQTAQLSSGRLTYTSSNKSRIFKQNAFGSGNYAASITFSIDLKSSTNTNAGSIFDFELAGYRGNTKTSIVSVYTGFVLQTTDTNLTMTVSGFGIEDQVDGWVFSVTNKVSSGSANSNAVFSNVLITYSLLEEGPGIIFNTTPREQALEFARYFLELTDPYCTEPISVATQNFLATEYAHMVNDAKTIFLAGEILVGSGHIYEDDISEALSRYVHMTREMGYSDFLSISQHINTQLRGLLWPVVSDSTNIVLIIGAASLIGVASLILYKKKKER